MKNFNEYILEKLKLSKKSVSTVQNDFVDLGLPSGTLWKQHDLGINVDHASFDGYKGWYGHLYAWGETKSKNNGLDWSSYKFSDNEGKEFSKYNKKDKLKDLEPEDDAAANEDPKWSIPTKEDFMELEDNTKHEWKNGYNGVKNLDGMLFTSNKNGETLFIPSSYQWREKGITSPSMWLATANTENVQQAIAMKFDKKHGWCLYTPEPKYNLYRIRPVIKK